MNSGFINGFSVNGAAYPSWVIRAVVVAAAVASFSVEQTRTTFASAYGDAVVSVSLTQTQLIKARANGTASASVEVFPTLTYTGASTAQATATGNGSVRRDVFASAGGDATCYAEALTAQAIGDANATMAASVVLADAHIVFPGRSITPCVATANCAGDVTRYPSVLAGYGQVVFTRGEASVKRSGTSFYELDGYVLNATAGANSAVPQDRVKITTTLGSFDYCDTTATARSFVTHSGAALATGITIAQSVVATHIYRPRVNAQGTATATINGTRNVLPTANATGRATPYAPKALINHAARGTAATQASVSAQGVRVTLGRVTTTASASVAKAVEYGVQHRATVSDSATNTASAAAKQRHAGRVTDAATGFVGQAVAFRRVTSRVDTTMANALVGRAYALANSEIKAPDDRYMIVSQEDRVMYVAAEDRTMVVTA